MTATDKPARRNVSAEEKAREALRIAEARHAKAEQRATKAKKDHDAATSDVESAAREVAAYRRLVGDLAPTTKVSAATPTVTTTTLPGGTA